MGNKKQHNLDGTVEFSALKSSSPTFWCNTKGKGPQFLVQ